MMTQTKPGTLLDLLPQTETAGLPWWRGERERAVQSIRASGLPSRQDEAWRFTPLKSIMDAGFRPGFASNDDAKVLSMLDSRLGDYGCERLVVVNGRPLGFQARLAGVAIQTMSELSEPHAKELAELAALAKSGAFERLNSALLEDGLVVRITGALSVPLEIVHISAPYSGALLSSPRLFVIAEPGSKAIFVETFVALEGASLCNSVTVVEMRDAAELDHVRLVEAGAGHHHLQSLHVRQHEASRYTSHVVSLGGTLTRLDLAVRLEGPDAKCRLNGVYHAANGEHVDHHTRVEHVSPRATSEEAYRGIVDGSGHAVFDGTMIVLPGAQQSQAHQENHNLLLSDDAVCHTKPHLEIEADDVSCSHGATVGSLDQDQMFYLRSRGVAAADAEAILTFAFVKAVLDELPHPPLAERMSRSVRSRVKLLEGDATQ